MTKTKNEAIETIAIELLFVEVLETRGSDGLDFHDLHVACIRAALEAAYEAGKAS